MPSNLHLSAPLVCIVDDDLSMADSTRCLVSSFGFRTEIFGSAEEFLRSSLLTIPNCLILDVRLPGMDGFELQRHLADSGKSVPIIFVTAHADETGERRAREEGATDFLRKPFTEEALVNAIRSALNR